MQACLCSPNKSDPQRERETDEGSSRVKDAGRGEHINLGCNLPLALAGSRLPPLLILSLPDRRCQIKCPGFNETVFALSRLSGRKRRGQPS